MILSSSVFYSDHALFPMSSIKLLVSAALTPWEGKLLIYIRKIIAWTWQNLAKTTKTRVQSVVSQRISLGVDARGWKYLISSSGAKLLWRPEWFIRRLMTFSSAPHMLWLLWYIKHSHTKLGHIANIHNRSCYVLRHILASSVTLSFYYVYPRRTADLTWVTLEENIRETHLSTSHQSKLTNDISLYIVMLALQFVNSWPLVSH